MKNKTYATGLIIGILSIPCGIIIAISGWILGIIGVILNSTKKDEFYTTPGLICSIVGLALSVINSILGLILALS